MPILEIITTPNPILRQKAKKVDLKKISKKELEQLAQDMVLTVTKADGAGLAAPQVGVSLRLIAVNHQKECLALINPEIITHSWSKELMPEGCLSVPGRYGEVKRYKWVKIKAQTIDGKAFEIKAEKLLSQIFQHEIDHLDGILFTDKAMKLF